MSYDRANIPATGVRHTPMHPGRLLAEEMEFRELNPNSLAAKLRVPRNRLAAIIAGDRAITPDTALRLERCLGLDASSLLRMQSSHDLAMARREIAQKIRDEVKPEPPVSRAA